MADDSKPKVLMYFKSGTQDWINTDMSITEVANELDDAARQDRFARVGNLVIRPEEVTGVWTP